MYASLAPFSKIAARCTRNNGQPILCNFMPDKVLSWYRDGVILNFPKLASLRNWASQAYVLISTLLGIQLNKM